MQIFARGRRHKYQLRCRLTVVFPGQSVINKGCQLGLKLFQSGFIAVRFVVAKAGQNHIGSDAIQPVIGRTKIIRTRSRRQSVSTESKVSNHQRVLWKTLMKQGFDVAKMLHPIGQRVTYDGDMIALLENDFRFGHAAGAGRP